MKYKKSKFNIFVPYNDEEDIIFNTFSGAIGRFRKETLERFNNDNLTNEEIKTLLDEGVLISEDFDEMEKINTDRIEGINNSNYKHYRIWPTSACNARCYYCFEKGIKYQTMTKEVADAVINFIAGRLNEGDTLKIEWFGGEPLLNPDIIDYIFTALKKIGKERNCKVFSSIITNGSLVTEEIALKMKNDWNIQLIQITLDGYGEDYNKIKNYRNCQKFNFDNVINAIKILLNNNLKVTIRMNYDTTNYESLAKLINFLNEELKDYKNVSYYVYPVWSSIDENTEEQFESTAQADKNLLKLYDLLIKHKLGTVKKIARLDYKPHSCQAWAKNSLTILPDGKITKCCESYNVVLGDVWEGVTNQKLFDFWTNSNLDEKCTNCPFIPLCQGGCKASYFSRMPQCLMLKPFFNDFLKWYVKHLDEEQNIENNNKR